MLRYVHLVLESRFLRFTISQNLARGQAFVIIPHGRKGLSFGGSIGRGREGGGQGREGRCAKEPGEVPGEPLGMSHWDL